MTAFDFRHRARLALVLTCAVGLGLLSRLRPVGWSLYDKSLGDALYAVAAYCALALATPAGWWREDRWRLAAVALTVCVGLEFFQATGIPASYAHLAVVRWLIGTTFAWHDVGCYCAGVALAFAVDRVLLRLQGAARSNVPSSSRDGLPARGGAG